MEGIQRALKWARLDYDYDYGARLSVSASLQDSQRTPVLRSDGRFESFKLIDRIS